MVWKNWIKFLSININVLFHFKPNEFQIFSNGKLNLILKFSKHLIKYNLIKDHQECSLEIESCNF